MARKLTFESKDGVECPVFAIRFRGGEWEDKWDCIRAHPDLESVKSVISRVSFDAFHKALSGYIQPLRTELGVPPEGCFAKVTEELKECYHRDNCIDYRPDECGPHLSFPVCFVANLDANFETRSLLTRLFEYWSSGRWVCLVPYDRKQDLGD